MRHDRALLGLANPLLRVDCPDPCVTAIDDGWLLVGTTFFDDIADKFPLWRSDDLQSWTAAGHVFPAGSTPTWAVGQFWAPEIHRAESGWRCYFTARDTSGRLCVGVAFAEQACGPYRDHGAPILRDEHVGLIDAHCFADRDGRTYLLWKVDGNDLVPQAPTPIRVQELAHDGVTLVGSASDAFSNDLPWENHVIEGPWAVRRGEYIYVFYSGNAFHSPDYRTGVARARHIRGPFEKLATPLLVNTPHWCGPGHGCVVTVGTEDLFVYHAWEAGSVFERHPRIPLVGRIVWENGWPHIIPAPER